MGFAQEMKDFMGAAQSVIKTFSDQSYKSSLSKYTDTQSEKMRGEMDVDKKLKEAKLAHTNAVTGQVGKVDELTQLRTEIARDQLRQMRHERENPGQYGVAGSVTEPPARAQAQAVPTEVPPLPTAKPNDEVPRYGLGLARGGMVEKFAIGGLAGDDDDEDDEIALPAGVTPPAIGAPPPGMPTDISAQARPRPAIGGAPMPQADPRKISNIDAVAAATKYGLSQAQPAQPGAVPTGRGSRGMQAYARGAGAAPADDMLALYRKIDPKAEMGESERNMTAIGTVYRYKMAKGDPQGANNAAMQMLQHYRTAAMQYAAIGAAALQQGAQTGDPKIIDSGLKAIMKSYANIPDGQEMKLWRSDDGRIGYSLKDQEGKEVKGGIASPQQILGSTLKIAGGDVEPYILAATGAQAQARAGGGKSKTPGRDPITGRPPEGEDQTETGKVPKPADRENLLNQVKSDIKDYVEAYKESDAYKKSGKELTKKELSTLSDVSYHIARTNDKTGPEAIRLAASFIGAPAELKKGEVPAFKSVQDPESKQITLTFRNGEALDMNERDFAVLRSAREEAKAQRAADAKKAEEDSKKGGWTKDAWDAVTTMAGNEAEAATKIPSRLSKMATDAVGEETTARVGSAVNAGTRAAKDAYEWLKRDAARQPAWTAAPSPEAIGRGIVGGVKAVGNALPSGPVPYDPSLETNAP